MCSSCIAMDPWELPAGPTRLFVFVVDEETKLGCREGVGREVCPLAPPTSSQTWPHFPPSPRGVSRHGVS